MDSIAAQLLELVTRHWVPVRLVTMTAAICDHATAFGSLAPWLSCIVVGAVAQDADERQKNRLAGGVHALHLCCLPHCSGSGVAYGGEKK
jgi:hypothetical protein